MRCRVAVKVGTSIAALHRSSSYNLRALPDDVQNLRSIGPGRNKSVGSGQEGLYLPKRVLLPPLSLPFCCIAVLAPIRPHYSYPGRGWLSALPTLDGIPTSRQPDINIVLHLVVCPASPPRKTQQNVRYTYNNFPLTKHPIVRTTTFSQNSPIDPSRVPLH